MAKLNPSNNDDISKESDLYQKAPTIFQMIKGFSNELVEYVKKGAPNVSAEDYADRLDTCKACMRCGLCGCMIQHKAKWKTTTCPDKPERWAKQEIASNEEKK